MYNKIMTLENAKMIYKNAHGEMLRTTASVGFTVAVINTVHIKIVHVL